MSFARGYNPIWFEVDLTANAFDDKFWLYVLENDLPYNYATVYQDPNGSVPWNNPINFDANGTLPNNIYFDTDVVYRLEFRENDGISPPSQSDPLIYLVENYVPGGSGSSPVVEGSVVTDNQITNPQFVLIDFPTTVTLSGLSDPDPIPVGPGWYLNLVGSGDVTLTRVPLNNSTTTITPTNAPYALRITTTGSFSSAYLSQAFEQNGNLWSTSTTLPFYVASSVTARLQGGTQNLSAILVNSEGDTMATVLSSVPITEAWNEYTDSGVVTIPADATFPPDGYVEYRLILPTTTDMYLTSFQLVGSFSDATLAYIQDTVDRQIDYTFHYYKDPLSYKPIMSYTLGWDFAFNPCQALGYNVAVQNTGANGSAYIADQTIVFQSVNESISATINNTGLILATAADTSFSIIQYLDSTTAVEILNQEVAMMVRAGILTGSGTINARVNLYWTDNASLPDIKAANYDSVVTSITSGVPAVVSGWNEVARVTPVPATFTISTTMTEFPLTGWDGRLASSGDINTASFFAVVITFENMVTTQQLTMKYASLVPGSIPTPPAPLSKAQTLTGLQYYYQKSFVPGVVPATAVGIGYGEQTFVQTGTGGGAGSTIMPINLPVPMINTPALVFYNPVDANGSVYNQSLGASMGTTTAAFQDQRQFVCSCIASIGSVGNILMVNWTADSRLGTY